MSCAVGDLVKLLGLPCKQRLGSFLVHGSNIETWWCGVVCKFNLHAQIEPLFSYTFSNPSVTGLSGLILRPVHQLVSGLGMRLLLGI